MKRYQNVSLVDLPLSPYDIIIVRKTKSGVEEIIRVQVKQLVNLLVLQEVHEAELIEHISQI